MQALGLNTIRTYAIDPTQDHSSCMKTLQDAGIYVISDLSAPGASINRDSPQWNDDLYTRYTSVIDDLQQYTNVLGFFAGNEVSNNASNTDASAFVKAAVRDMKAYIKQKGYRTIGVGYATNDNADIRANLANYFDCGSSQDSIDFWGYNIYSWCGNSSFAESGYDVRTQEFSSYNVPAFFAEYGCNTVRPRTFSEVLALYGDQMTPVWSGGIVYEWFQEANDFGNFHKFWSECSKLISQASSPLVAVPQASCQTTQLCRFSSPQSLRVESTPVPIILPIPQLKPAQPLALTGRLHRPCHQRPTRSSAAVWTKL